MAPSSLQPTDGALHAKARRLEQITSRSRTRLHIDCGDRDGPVELAGCRIVPGRERQPLKKLAADQDGLLQLLHRWWKEAAQAEHTIKRIAVTYEVGRDGFWLARVSTGATARRRNCARRQLNPKPISSIAAHNGTTLSWNDQLQLTRKYDERPR